MEKHKAVLYARSNNKNEETLNKQLEALRTYAEKNNYEVAKEYTDFGCDTPTERTGMATLLTDSVKGNVESVLMTDFDRLSRKKEEMFAVAEILNAADVKIVSINQPSADMHAVLEKLRYANIVKLQSDSQAN